MKRILFGLFFVLACDASLYAQMPFYEGKSVRIVVGFSPGGTYDLWARLMAHHLSKHVPGSPSFVVQNMTGGGSMVAANHVYTVAKPDGLTFGLVTPALYIEQLAGRNEVQHDWLSFPMSARQRELPGSFIFARLATGASRIFEKRRSHPSVVLRGQVLRVIIGPNSSQTPLVSS